MTYFRFLTGACVAGLLVVAACESSEDAAPTPAGEADAAPDSARAGNDGGGGGDDSSTIEGDADAGKVPSVAAADVCPAAAKKICAFLATCSPEMVAGLWASPSECEPRFRDNCLAAYPEDALVRKDDADDYATCLGNLTCDDLYGPRWTVACRTPRLAATKTLGQTCRSDFECATSTCTGTSTTCGYCVEPKKPGESCTKSGECGTGAFCSEDKCIVPAFLGEACDANRICGNGLACVSAKCVKIGTGDMSCDSDLDCDLAQLYQCNRGTGKCEKTTFIDPGETCPKAFDEGPPKECWKGSSCIRPAFEAGTCVTNAKVGEACGPTQRCEAFINCRDDKCVLPTYKACP
jgi:hypothetical protein